MNFKIRILLPACAALLFTMQAGAQGYTQTHALVEKSADLISQQFVDEESGRRTADALRQRLASGLYAGIKTANELEKIVTQDMRSISGDRHIGIVFDPASVARYRARAAAADSELAKRENEVNKTAAIAESRLDNFGLRQVEAMTGGVGYVRLDYFDGLVEEGTPAIAAAMDFLAGSDAIILDLRYNGGGNSKAMPFFLSYFLAQESTHFATRVERWKSGSQALYTLAEVQGARHVNKDLYILTSGTTFSLAEQITYHLKAFGRATIVGERTYGGGNGFDPVVLDDNFYLRIPRVAFRNAITGTVFEEGKGIAPDIAVTAHDAKNRAYVEALIRMKQNVKAEDQERRAEIDWALALARARLNVQLKMHGDDHERQFAGRYGEYVFQAKADGLWLSFQDLPFVRLERLGEGLYLDERAIQRQFQFTAHGKESADSLLVSRFGKPAVRVPRSTESANSTYFQ